MVNLKDIFGKTSETINKYSKMLIIILFAVAFLATVYQVISRFILQSSFVQNIFPMVDFSIFNFSWIEELIRYLFIWIVFLGIGVVYKSKEHAQVELLHHYSPEKWKNRISLFIEIVNSSVFVFLIMYGWSILKFTSQQISPSMGLNMTLIYSAVLVSSIICLIHAIESVINITIGKRKTAKVDPINENSSVG